MAAIPGPQNFIGGSCLYHGGSEFSPLPGTNLEALRARKDPEEALESFFGGDFVAANPGLQRLIGRSYVYHGGYEFSPLPGTNIKALRVGNDPEEALEGFFGGGFAAAIPGLQRLLERSCLYHGEYEFRTPPPVQIYRL